MIEQHCGYLEKGTLAETSTLKKTDNSSGLSLIPSHSNGFEGYAGLGKTSTEMQIVMMDVRFIRFVMAFWDF